MGRSAGCAGRGGIRDGRRESVQRGERGAAAAADGEGVHGSGGSLRVEKGSSGAKRRNGGKAREFRRK